MVPARWPLPGLACGEHLRQPALAAAAVKPESSTVKAMLWNAENMASLVAVHYAGAALPAQAWPHVMLYCKECCTGGAGGDPGPSPVFGSTFRVWQGCSHDQCPTDHVPELSAQHVMH